MGRAKERIRDYPRDDHEQGDAAVKSHRRDWYFRDVLLVTGIVLGGGPLHLMCIIGYAAGRRNDRGMMFTVACIFILTFGLVAVSCLIALLARIIRAWPKHLLGRKKLWGYRFLVISGLAGYIVLPFTGLIPSGLDGYMHGFGHHVHRTVDIPAVQVWLSILRPEVCTGEIIRIRKNDGPAVWPDTMNWPKCLTNLDPLWAKFEKTDDGRVKIRLSWGTPWAMWGPEIGPQDMEIPKTQDRARREYGPPGDRQVLYDHGEYRLSIAPGAHVWQEIR